MRDARGNPWQAHASGLCVRLGSGGALGWCQIICHVQDYSAHLWLLLTFAEADVGMTLETVVTVRLPNTSS